MEPGNNAYLLLEYNPGRASGSVIHRRMYKYRDITKDSASIVKAYNSVMVMFYGVGHWNAFFNALLYLSDTKKFPLQLILREILISNEMTEMMGGADDTLVKQQLMAESIKYAVIVVSSLPVLCLYPFLQKYFIQGVMVGAIKG